MVAQKKISVVIGADHRGFELKNFLTKTSFKDTDIAWIDVGAFNAERSDYPEFSIAAAQVMLAKKADQGILICASGVGMAIAANRFHGIYAGVAWNEKIATESKEDDGCNVLVLPSDFVNQEQALRIVEAWLHAEFKEGRYQKRLDMIDAIK